VVRSLFAELHRGVTLGGSKYQMSNMSRNDNPYLAACSYTKNQSEIPRKVSVIVVRVSTDLA
jgi:hypothetical protein